jgi:hypothetical protein
MNRVLLFVKKIKRLSFKSYCFNEVEWILLQDCKRWGLGSKDF